MGTNLNSKKKMVKLDDVCEWLKKNIDNYSLDCAILSLIARLRKDME